MSNPHFTYILIKRFVNIFLITFLKLAWAHFTQLNGFSYYKLARIILFNINHLFADNKVVTSITMYHYSNKLQSFVYAQLNDQTILFLTIQFNTSHLLAHSFIWTIDQTPSGATTTGQNGPGSNGNEVVVHIPPNSRIGASPSDCFVSYSRYSEGVLTLLPRCSRCIL